MPNGKRQSGEKRKENCSEQGKLTEARHATKTDNLSLSGLSVREREGGKK